MVSADRSNIFTIPNTSGEVREQICTILNIMIEALIYKYLSLPETMGLDKTNTFQYLIDCVWQRVNGWKERELSAAGGCRCQNRRISGRGPELCV